MLANGYVTEVRHPTGQLLKLVPPPVQFDGVPPPLSSAPGVGADTDAVLHELGLTRARSRGTRSSAP